MDALRGFFDLDIGLHGWIALAITAVGVTALNVGLMALARKRWDPDFRPDRDDDGTD